MTLINAPQVSRFLIPYVLMSFNLSFYVVPSDTLIKTFLEVAAILVGSFCIYPNLSYPWPAPSLVACQSFLNTSCHPFPLIIRPQCQGGRVVSLLTGLVEIFADLYLTVIFFLKGFIAVSPLPGESDVCCRVFYH